MELLSNSINSQKKRSLRERSFETDLSQVFPCFHRDKTVLLHTNLLSHQNFKNEIPTSPLS